jgi:hypothetical protein
LKQLGTDLAQCKQHVTKIDRAQASQAQLSMASFQQPDRPASRGIAAGAKSTTDATAIAAANASGPGVSSVELDKLKNRVVEIEKILMEQELTMKNLGDDEGKTNKSSGHVGKKSAGKFDKDWTTKVEQKLSKLNTTVKNLTNKISDLGNSSALSKQMTRGGKNRNSQRSLSGNNSQSSFRYRNGPGANGTGENHSNDRRG